MSGSVEERLRRALTQQAETTTTSPDAWRRIRGAMDGGGRMRRRLPIPWTVLAPIAVVVVLVISLAALVDGDGDRTLHVTGESGRLYLAPTGVEPRFRFDRAYDGPTGPPQPPWNFRAFGRRAPDGVALQASVVITLPGERAVQASTPEPEPLRVLGRDVHVAGDPFGQRNLYWTQDDGRTVGVMTFGLSQAELTAVAESLLSADVTTAVPVLPAGFAHISSGAFDVLRPMALQSWVAGDGDRFWLTVAHDPDARFDDLVWSLPGGRVKKVRDTTGAYLAREETYMTWIERPGTVVTLHGSGLSEQELLDIAEGLRPIDEATWRELTDRVPAPPPEGVGPVPETGPPPGAAQPDNAYFVMVPVRRMTAPPCTQTAPNLVIPLRHAGQEVSCVHVGSPLVFADDVFSAVIFEEPAGVWALEYTMTAQGAADMQALFREVGAGGQFAILADMRIVAAPPVDGRPPTGGVIGGLDEQTARSLADRLGR
jgi:hypothetical protein